jgi:hypothetical protein
MVWPARVATNTECSLPPIRSRVGPGLNGKRTANQPTATAQPGRVWTTALTSTTVDVFAESATVGLARKVILPAIARSAPSASRDRLALRMRASFERRGRRCHAGGGLAGRLIVWQQWQPCCANRGCDHFAFVDSVRRGRSVFHRWNLPTRSVRGTTRAIGARWILAVVP